MPGATVDRPVAITASERLGVAALVVLTGATGGFVACNARDRAETGPTASAAPAATTSSPDAPEVEPSTRNDETRRPVPVYGAPPSMLPTRTAMPAIGRLTVSEGAVPDAVRVIAAMSSSFHACHERLLGAYPRLVVTVTLVMQVDADGAVSAASAEPLGGVAQQSVAELATCVARRARHVRFLPPTSGNRVSLTVQLKFSRPEH